MHNILHFTSSAYGILKQTVGTCLPESGAIIGTPMGGDDGHITLAQFDTEAGWGKDYYAPSDEINRILCQWARNQYRFTGIVHSHGDRCPNQLSGIDLRSAMAILQNNAMPFIYMGIFHQGELFMYKVLPDGSTETLQITVDPEN